MSRRRLPIVLLLVVSIAAPIVAGEPCRIEVVERGSGWPVPLVELRTTSEVRFVTDNAGVIAIDAPDLMHREVFFHVSGHGYEVPADGFGIRGVRLTLEPGTTRRIQVNRTSIARRIGRLTGAGLFVHSSRFDEELDRPESGVVGCDSVQMAVHRGRRHWVWGDTTLLHYPLGIFHAGSATTGLDPIASPSPPLQVTFDYFRDDNDRPRSVAKLAGSGPTWLTGLVTLPDEAGTERLVACYAKIKPPLEAYEQGLCVWNDQTGSFERLKVVWSKSDDRPTPPPLPQGHAVFWTDGSGARQVLFGDPLPTLRCPATFEAWQDPGEWRTLEPQQTIVSATDGTAVKPHSGSIGWHGWRKRWVTVFMQSFGKPSSFGELWYAEADSPIGPWGPAVKVLSHDNYTFYNPRLHIDLTPADSPILLFEGTYTQQFADKPHPTPRYDYNQILYRLDLDDERLRAAGLP